MRNLAGGVEHTHSSLIGNFYLLPNPKSKNAMCDRVSVLECTRTIEGFLRRDLRDA